ncbi:CPBP family intramembrane glutamic endopeptidase [Clostridium coskatii]|uniref:CAAX amino terminal protease self-immunity n=1 Tax=Clostridium coskatii TaxID=1705578 RepID=A0A166UFM7_9CLOT|nr:type II CAAX endopeptidase family protein [Clostridium coskatii]OAA94880.1 CAAX amino terminal protease self- immunity [Clostridium coskatii]OBR93762.1 CAAX amino terminal protease self- immunity [Clostridium coskatii]
MNNKNYKYLTFTLFAAAILWYLMFVIKPFNFWIEMSGSILLLILMAFFVDRDIFHFGKIKGRYILIGVVSAIVLYGVFYAGNIISGYLFPFKDAQISSVYSNKLNANLALIGLLLFFIIGPGEELYWRGFIQNTLGKEFGENKGYLFSVLLYAAVHIVTGNFMLIIAALVCGLFWGWLYKKEKSLIPVIISHAIWDLTIFVLLPLM